MTSKERFINALEFRKNDRLPVTTHHIMEYFLKRYMNGIDGQEFFNTMGADPILWIDAFKENKGEYVKNGYIQSDNWQIVSEEIPGQEYKTIKHTIVTPQKNLTIIIQSNQYTSWVVEHLIKEKNDIEIIHKYAPVHQCNVEKINAEAEAYGNRGLVRGAIPSFHFFGQPGCWQDVACLYGIEKLIMETFDDPKWVHAFLEIMLERKLEYVKSLKGAKFDLIELGGGDASSTVISPQILNDFVMPYDSLIIKSAKEINQRISYHTCGGMMPILEDLASMEPCALETFTPIGMGGDVDLREAKRRIGDKVCMIGGFDQGQFFINCSEQDTRKAVRQCFEEAGQGGGFILCPSDHFFDADPKLIKAFVDEAKKCIY